MKGKNHYIENIFSDLKIYSHSIFNDQFGYDDFRPEFNGEYHIIDHLIKPGNIVFDVGANIGMWSKKILSSIPNIKVYSFEPVGELFEILKNNLSNYTGINIHNIAISDKQSIRNFYYYNKSLETSGLSSFYRRPLPEYLNEMEPVELEIKTETLDSFCEEFDIARIDYLKIDTEGGELDVLKGAESLLQKKLVVAIQFEYGGTYADAGITLKQVIEALQQYNFHIYRILPNGLIYIKEWLNSLETYRYSNYLAINPD